MPLEFVQLSQRHTGKYLAQTIQLVVEKFNIQNQICGIVSDNATNNKAMVKELKRLKWPQFKGKTKWIQCFAHDLNLIVQGILWPFGTHKKKESCYNNPLLVDCDASCEEDDLEGQIQILARGEEPAGLSKEELSDSDSIGKADRNNSKSLVKEDIKNCSNEEAGDLYKSSSCKQSLAKA
ncbi:hypothetical protein PCASD_04173 [Puccinia coronata f. sp. avenae]|uniref:DUF659 domain-containing protein n=1 Tax=Puccinia coronata f. sp. avenae TaxID=200324 RepID=A0A2N5V811_9BASI|nr:hypothetical protein PCASD_04173 [Puccinia coronata f. sp. avenae]